MLSNQSVRFRTCFYYKGFLKEKIVGMKLGCMCGLEVVLFLLSIGLAVFPLILFVFQRIGRFSRPIPLQIDEEMISDVLSYKAYIK